MSSIRQIRSAIDDVASKVRSAGWRLAALGAAPAFVFVCVLYWTAETYVASMGLPLIQWLSVALCAIAYIVLKALTLGRMTHYLLRPVRRPQLHFALEIGSTEARSVLAFGLFSVLALAVGALSFLVQWITSKAFFIVGSEGIERLVAGFGHAIVAVGGLFFIARLSPLISSAAVGRPGLRAVWLATDEEAGKLLVLIWVLPGLTFLAIACPILWALGVLPLPGPADVIGGARMIDAFRLTGWLAGGVLWIAVLTHWILMAAGLCLTHEKLLPDQQKRGLAGRCTPAQVGSYPT